MEIFSLLASLSLLLLASLTRADVEGQREVPQEEDMFAPNSVPMMGKKAGKSWLPLPMLRLKKAEEESPFVYKTPWHIGKRSSVPDIYTASWIGSLFKPSSADIEIKPHRRMKRLNKGKKSAMSWEWDNLMRGSPGFRFNDNQNYLYDRDIMHKRNREGMEEKEEEVKALPSNLEDWGEFNDFSGLMEDVSLYPSSLGLFDRTILTRVQKRPSHDQEETEVKKRELTETPPKKNKDGSVSASAIRPVLKSSMPNDFLFNPWAFDSLNYGR